MLVRRRRAISLCKQMGSVAGRAHMNPIEQIAVGCGVAKRTARGFICRCPAHEDRMPSLSIGYGHHGNILVHCLAGCDGNSVTSALRERGLWPWQPRIDRLCRSTSVATTGSGKDRALAGVTVCASDRSSCGGDLPWR
jgi:hypothetical protein